VQEGGPDALFDDEPGGPVDRFTYDALPGRVVFGAGASRTELAPELARLGASRVLLVASGSAVSPARERTQAVPVVGEFTEVREHVPVPVAEKARSRAAEVGADAVLAFGGGSSVGTAKAIALTTGLPILCVPTTYAGSEATPVWGMTEGGRKTTGRDERVLPRTIVYDPELTYSLPARIAAASGLNAMAHCVEAFWAPRANPVSTALAEDGIRALGAGLARIVDEPSAEGARADALYGAYLAGTCLAGAGSGLHHAICHALGGAYDLPHALTHATVLPHVVAYTLPYAAEASHRMRRALDTDDPAGALRALATRLAIPAGLRELGLTEDRLEPVVDRLDGHLPAGHPRPTDRAALRALLHDAWAGTTPKETV
jgi:alcohol dehydrogenase class IV